MAIRIIQVNQPNEFWEQLRKNGKYKQSQRRSGRLVNVKEGDIVYIFVIEEDVLNGDIRYKCCVTKTNERTDNNEDTYATLNLDETYSKGTCTYSDLRSKGFIKNAFFHWNILPELAEYIGEKCKNNESVKEKPVEKKLKTTDKKTKSKEKRKKAMKKKEIKKKDDKKKEVKDVKKKDDKKKEVNKKDTKKKKK